jgi:hypothetical protein
MLSVVYAQRSNLTYYATGRYAQCHNTEFRYAMGVIMLIIIMPIVIIPSIIIPNVIMTVILQCVITLSFSECQDAV